MPDIFTLLTAAVAVLWAAMLLRGRFWRAAPHLPDQPAPARRVWPSVVAVVPARNEAAFVERTLESLRRQEYGGRLTIVLVDDGSEDDTAARARRAGQGPGHPLTVVQAAPPPAGWAGKVWAMDQGLNHARELAPKAKYLWFTDADVEHDPRVLARLVQQAEYAMLDMVSTLVMLSCRGLWERILIPAFVFFFQKLYPFHRVNDPASPAAAAAGGCMLVRRTALRDAGGLATIGSALIDDCALARALKNRGQIWLGLTRDSRSLRSYGLSGVWAMVTRTAFTQLGYSPLRLAGVAVGMVILYLLPIAALIAGAAVGHATLLVSAGAALALMAIAYRPTLKLYGQPLVAALGLPVAAALYVLMTLDSARRYWQGRGGTWKDRVQAPTGE